VIPLLTLRLLLQSILRDAVTDLSLHYLAKMKIMVVTDIERDEVEFICKTLNCNPIASVDDMVAEKLGSGARSFRALFSPLSALCLLCRRCGSSAWLLLLLLLLLPLLPLLGALLRQSLPPCPLPAALRQRKILCTGHRVLRGNAAQRAGLENP